jgi:hypothetical protein
MIINDLSYLEVVAENRVVGGDFDFDSSIDFSSNVDINKNVCIDVNIYSDADIKDNVALAEASANALGNNTFTEVLVSTYTDNSSSHSGASAQSATD